MKNSFNFLFFFLFFYFKYVIPLSVISFVYIQMAIRLWGSKTPGNAQDARDINLLKNKKRVSITVFLFFGCCCCFSLIFEYFF